MMTIEDFKKYALNELKKSPSPMLDVNVLLEHFLDFNKTQILLNYKKEILPEQENLLRQAVQKRKTGLPIAYITGKKDFFGYEFDVSPAVLIPKPDTEILVERGIEIILEKMENHPNLILTVCDMCTGSGCIGLSVAKALIDIYKISSANLPKFTLADISPAALEIAMQNAKKLGIPSDKVRFVRSNLFEQFSNDGGWTFDVILTNPPYVPHEMVEELLRDGRNEPRLALDGDVCTQKKDGFMPGDFSQTDDGLEIIRSLLPQCYNHLCPEGVILMETGEYNALDAQKIASSHHFKTTLHKDLEGQLRVVECWKDRAFNPL